jgi:hypothetical protein
MVEKPQSFKQKEQGDIQQRWSEVGELLKRLDSLIKDVSP